MCATDYWYVQALNQTANTVLMYITVLPFVFLAASWCYKEIRKG